MTNERRKQINVKVQKKREKEQKEMEEKLKEDEAVNVASLKKAGEISKKSGAKKGKKVVRKKTDS